MVTMAGSSMFIVGCFLSLLWPYVCITFTQVNEKIDSDVLAERLKREMGIMLLWQAIFESIIVFMVILFFKSMYFNKYG